MDSRNNSRNQTNFEQLTSTFEDTLFDWHWAPVEEEGDADELTKPADFCHQTNYDRIIKSLESLANEMVFESMKGVYRYRIGEKVSTKAFRTKEEALQDAVEYLEQDADNV